MYCRDCVRYDSEAEKCLDGKVNPPRYEQAVSVSQTLGLRSICMFNDHRERLISVRSGAPGAHRSILKVRPRDA